MAAALAYRWDGGRTRLYFQTRQGTYNEHSLIEFVRELRRHFRGQQVILIWDGLPSHRSRLMTEFLAKQRHWLEVRRLPAYAPGTEPGRGGVGQPQGARAGQSLRGTDPKAGLGGRGRSRSPAIGSGPAARLPPPHGPPAVRRPSCRLV